MNGRTLTCVYCGHEYPQDTPAHGDSVLTEHIKICERHPMRKAESDIALLRAALVGLIGFDNDQDLRQMELTMRLLPDPAEDKAASINAIHALLATVEDGSVARAAIAAAPISQQLAERDAQIARYQNFVDDMCNETFDTWTTGYRMQQIALNIQAIDAARSAK